MSESKPLVSILIPLYNAERWIGETLESALNQTYSPTEIIVVDDGSTDGSLEIAQKFKSEGVTVLSQDNKGACAARNRAFERSEGNYIQYLDADDLLAPDKIETQMERLRSEPEKTVAAAPWERFCERPGDYNPLSKSYVAWRDFEDPLEWLVLAAEGRAMSPPHAWLMPRLVLEAAGPWDENLLINQDGEYFARALLQSSKIAFCPETCVYYRSGSTETISSRRSPEALRSWYRSLRMIEGYMLSRKKSSRVRSACAAKLWQFVHSAYPDVPDLVEKAEKRIAQLGGTPLQVNGSLKYRLTAKVFGWKTAKWLRRIYYYLRYNETI